jgi:hypothetical protein
MRVIGLSLDVYIVAASGPLGVMYGDCLLSQVRLLRAAFLVQVYVCYGGSLGLRESWRLAKRTAICTQKHTARATTARTGGNKAKV